MLLYYNYVHQSITDFKGVNRKADSLVYLVSLWMLDAIMLMPRPNVYTHSSGKAPGISFLGQSEL